MTELDRLIDVYLGWEASYRPKSLGYPGHASGMGGAISSRQWQETHELLDEAENNLELRALEGAWASLTRIEDRALRMDAANRHARVTVWRIAGHTAEQTRDAVEVAKLRLRRLLSDRGLYV